MKTVENIPESLMLPRPPSLAPLHMLSDSKALLDT